MDGKQSTAMLAPPTTPPTSPITQLQVRIKELETGLRSWLVKQPTAVEAAIVTATSAAQGAFIGALMGSLTSDAAIPTPPPNAPGLNSQAMASLKQAQAFAGGPLVQARNFAVMTGTNAGISCVMRRIRGVEDMQSSIVAAFGSGAMFSLVSGMGGPNQAVNAVTSGLFFALIQGGIFKNYEKNFKKGLLNDATLPLLTESALRDVNIPPGPRLIILDHIQRNRDLVKR